MDFFIILFFIVFILLGAFVPDKTSIKIKIDDINVGDELRIKGEKFFVKAYASDGNTMALSKRRNGDAYCVIEFDKNVKFISHNSNDKRKYIIVKNFKGTIGGDYIKKS